MQDYNNANFLNSSKKLSPETFSCTSCTNTNCLIKKNLNYFDNSDFLESKNILRLKKGQQFIIEGTPVNGLYFIFNASVKVFRTGINGREQIVRFASNGEIIGHRGFGTQEFYSIGATAINDAFICYFSKDVLQQTLQKNPKFTYDFMLFYADELNRSESKVKTISQMTVRERVIDTLLYIYRKFGETNGFLKITLSRREYADYAGTTEQQVIRVFSALKKEELIVAKGKKIGIPNADILKKEISEHNFFLDT